MMIIPNLHGISLNEARALLAKINYDHRWTLDALREAADTLSPEDRQMLPEALRIAGEALEAEAKELEAEVSRRRRKRIGLRAI